MKFILLFLLITVINAQEEEIERRHQKIKRAVHERPAAPKPSDPPKRRFIPNELERVRYKEVFVKHERKQMPSPPTRPLKKDHRKQKPYLLRDREEAIKMTRGYLDQLLEQKESVLVRMCKKGAKHCDKFHSQEYERAINHLHSKYTFVASYVDCDTDREFCQDFNIQLYPTLLFFKAGNKTPERYDSNRMHFRGIEKFVGKILDK